MEQILQQILNKLDNLEAGQQELRNDVVGLKNDVVSLKDDVVGLKDDVVALKAGQQEVRYDIRTLKTGQEKLETNIATIQENIATIQKDTVLIPSIKQAVSEVGIEISENSETTVQIQTTIDKHEIILDTLSIRSIEQEAKLKHIV